MSSSKSNTIDTKQAIINEIALSKSIDEISRLISELQYSSSSSSFHLNHYTTEGATILIENLESEYTSLLLGHHMVSTYNTPEERVHFLLTRYRNEIDIDFPDRNNRKAPIFHAIDSNNPRLVKLLLDSDVNLNITFDDSYNEDPDDYKGAFVPRTIFTPLQYAEYVLEAKDVKDAKDAKDAGKVEKAADVKNFFEKAKPNKANAKLIVEYIKQKLKTDIIESEFMAAANLIIEISSLKIIKETGEKRLRTIDEIDEEILTFKRLNPRIHFHLNFIDLYDSRFLINLIKMIDIKKNNERDIVELIEYLLRNNNKYHIDVNLPDNKENKKLPIFYAIESKSIRLVALLLDNGASLDSRYRMMDFGGTDILNPFEYARILQSRDSVMERDNHNLSSIIALIKERNKVESNKVETEILSSIEKTISEKKAIIEQLRQNPSISNNLRREKLEEELSDFLEQQIDLKKKLQEVKEEKDKMGRKYLKYKTKYLQLKNL